MIVSLEDIEKAQRWIQRNTFFSYFPDTGPLRRELYSRHMDFLRAGATHMQRLCIAANRVGKTELGIFETTAHATGLYPEWWEGRRFPYPIEAWVAGKTSETTRDILQAKLIGKIQRGANSDKIGIGTGMIPADKIVATTPKAGVPDACDSIFVRHVSGGVSTIGLKSYGKDRDSWEGTAKSLILLDEEPPSDVMGEALMRLMSTVPGRPNGSMMITFTPLEGYTEVVKSFLETDDPNKHVTTIRWVDAPHLTPEAIEALSKSYLPSQLKARSEGIPAIGEGAVYPIDIDDICVDPFKVPDTWPRFYGFDVGQTAVLWLAWDRDSDVVYAYDEYFSREYNPAIHADAIKARGAWIPGAIDPASLQSNQMDGQKLFQIYKDRGLNVQWERTGVESGIQEVWMRLSTGRLKFFTHLSRLKMEFQRYHRQKSETVFGVQDKIVKKDDHLCDALRMAIVSGLKRACTHYAKPTVISAFESGSFADSVGSAGWQVM